MARKFIIAIAATAALGAPPSMTGTLAAHWGHPRPPVCTENHIRVDAMMESPKLAE